MNNVSIMGNMASDPRVTRTETTTVARFSVAINRGKDKTGKDLGADFPNCVAFGKTAENIEKYFGKGKPIAITGHLQTGSYEKDGKKVFTTDVIVERFDFCGGDKTKASDKTSDSVPEGFSALTGEDIPF